MSDAYEITKQKLHRLVVTEIFVILMVFFAGFIIGRKTTGGRGKSPEPPHMAVAKPAENTGDGAEAPAPRKTPLESGGDRISYVTQIDIPGGDSSPASGGGESGASREETVTITQTMDEGKQAETTGDASGTLRDSPTPTPGDWYAVQVASVRNYASAKAEMKKLRKKGYPAYIHKRVFRNGRINYEVRVGPYPGRRKAGEVGDRLERQERIGILIRKVSRTDNPDFKRK